MRLVIFAFMMISFMMIFIGGVLYASLEARDYVIQSEEDISAIIDNNPNMTIDQKVSLISIMCENGAPMPVTATRCKDALFLKYTEQR